MMTLLLSPITALHDDLPVTASETVLAVLEAALSAVDPGRAVRRALALQGTTLRVGTHPAGAAPSTRSYDLRTYEHIYVVGAGKASAAMASALEEVLGPRITAGWINVKDGYTAPTHIVTIHEAGHPLPDARGLAGSEKIAQLLQQAGPDDLVFCLISGGGSALMELPVEGITLSQMERLTQALLRCGATINEMNVIRKHLSQLKGGQLVRMAQPAQVIALILSDVIGNPLDVIASGPTCPDPSTFAQAYEILQKYNLLQEIPAAIVQHLERGIEGAVPETTKAGDSACQRTQNVVVGSNELAAQAALDEARRQGLHGMLLSTFVEGEAREVARVLAAIAREIAHSGQPLPRPACIVAGGETTVTVRGQGLGGRNQELALAAAPWIAGLENVAVLALGTDGTDGPTNAAGAICTGRTAQRAAQQGLSMHGFLAENDAYHLFQALNDLVITGPTNTNVNDLVFVFAF
jgi:glycerate 2-kinase